MSVPMKDLETVDGASFSWNAGISVGALVVQMKPGADHLELTKFCKHMMLPLTSVKGFDDVTFLLGVGYSFACMIGIPQMDLANYDTKVVTSDPQIEATQAMRTKKDWQVPS